jgi:hypothetical protein
LHGRQERPVIFVSGGEDVPVERTWEERARASIAATLHAVCDRTPLLSTFDEASDIEYFERVEIARRFGCDDETEAMAHLEEILGEDLTGGGDLAWDEDPRADGELSAESDTRGGPGASRPGAAGRPAGERPAAWPHLPSRSRRAPASTHP